MRIALKDISTHLGPQFNVFIGSYSFDSRFACVAQQLDRNCIKKIIIFSCPNLTTPIEQQRLPFEKIFVDPISMIALHDNQSIENVKSIERVLMEQIFDNDNIIVDITTFTHENLLLLVRIMQNLGLIGKARFIYTGAEKYGSPSGETSEKATWLSRGVQDVRAVLGYPGLSLPSRRLHLLMMIGFESERAEVVIEHYEPTILSIGLGDKQTSLSEEHHRTNQHFYQRVSMFAEDILGRVTSSVNGFQFSCNNPIETKHAILQQVENHADYNTVICPLNTKMSTLGAAFAALENENIQLCYPKPIEYNIKHYAIPGSYCTIFNGADL